MAFVEVVFNVPVHHAFTYRVPEDIENLQPGMRVLASFGKRTLTGIVVNISDTTDLKSTKPILDVLDEKPLINREMLELTHWIADYYFSSWGQALQLALPRGIDSEEKDIIHLIDPDGDEKLTEKQRELYHIIGAQPGNTIDFYRRKFGQSNFYYFLNRLEEKALIERQRIRRDARVSERIRKFVVVAENYEQHKNNYEDYLKYIIRRPEIDAYMMRRRNKAVLMSEFLKETGMASATLKKMDRYNLCDIVEMAEERQPQFNYNTGIMQVAIQLNAEQKEVIDTIGRRLKEPRFQPYLLHGVTGSGKTQVYIEILKGVLKQGKTAIILIPEIALTPQTVHRFKSTFSEKIAVFHSRMSLGERFDAWMGCYNQQVKIVVGPRSALFVPLKHLGLIVVDEEHETTYKQTDNAPRYHARDTAVFRAKINDALIILGSATPSLESYYNTRKEKYHLLPIRNRVKNIKMPYVTIVDMRKNRYKKSDNDKALTLFSEKLVDKIDQRLQNNEQVILLQNRRGYSSFMQCKRCGYIAVCPNCDVSLTYHSYNEMLQCHFCGYRQHVYYECPNCNGEQIVYKGVGTQRIQKELNSLFPKARILRMDQDTTRGKNRHDQILNSFSEGRADILLGTQMIAKGLDFANVTLVGVVSADVGLAIPDFRAPERVFQLLTQVAGRSGRGDKSGEVIIQSYQYAHYAIQYAREHDYVGFYMEEMRHRKDYKYPPYQRLIQILFTSDKMSHIINTARNFALNINKRGRAYCEVIGPSPTVIPKIKNMFRWQLMLRLNQKKDPQGRNTKALLKQLIFSGNNLIEGNTRIAVDVDPILMH